MLACSAPTGSAGSSTRNEASSGRRSSLRAQQSLLCCRRRISEAPQDEHRAARRGKESRSYAVTTVKVQPSEPPFEPQS